MTQGTMIDASRVAARREQAAPDFTDIDQHILFYIVASASFVEITSDLYTRNLGDFFGGDDEIVAWLRSTWESQELGHGARLREYVERSWPDFDWAGSYARFFAEFREHCTPAALPTSRAAQLAGLCVVETGTAGLYRMLADAATDADLRRVAGGIGAEEIGHYKQFLRHFRRYRVSEKLSLTGLFRALYAQATAIDGVDSYYAFKHVYETRNPGLACDDTAYRRFRGASRRLARAHFPYRMAIKMLLKLLALPVSWERLATPPLASMSRLLLLR